MAKVFECETHGLWGSSLGCPTKQCKPKKDEINHPSHYTQGKIEVITVIEDQKFDYIEGNIFKYLARYKHKNGIVDVRKMAWYANRLLQREEKKFKEAQRGTRG